jgi:hypothetical protein
MRLKRHWLIGLLILGMATPCLANPMGSGLVLSLPLALAGESLLVALLMIPLGLRFFRVFFVWAGITMVSWILMFLSMNMIDNLFPEVGGALPSRSSRSYAWFLRRRGC